MYVGKQWVIMAFIKIECVCQREREREKEKGVSERVRENVWL